MDVHHIPGQEMQNENAPAMLKRFADIHMNAWGNLAASFSGQEYAHAMLFEAFVASGLSVNMFQNSENVTDSLSKTNEWISLPHKALAFLKDNAFSEKSDTR